MEFKVPHSGFRARLFGIGAMLLAGMGCASTVVAGEGQFYLAGGGGVSTITPATRGVNVQTGFSVEDDSDGLIKLFAGYDLTDYWSIEGFYANYGTAKLTGPGRFIGGSNPSGLGNDFLTNGDTIFGTVDYTIVGGQTLLQFPDNKAGLSAILKLGVSQILKNSSSNLPFDQADETKFTTGFGLEYQLKNGVAVRAEYEYHDEDTQGISISALKRFGGRKVKTTPPKVVQEGERPQPRQQPQQQPRRQPARSEAKPQPRPVPRPTPPQNAAAPRTAPASPAPAAPPPRPGLSVAQSTDGDRDGVIDRLDRCPGTPPGKQVGADGCAIPEAMKTPLPATFVSSGEVSPRILEGVTFQSGSAVLTSEAKRILDGVAADLIQRPEVRVTVVGHTDNVGSARKNKQLSERRAEAVANYLAARGVDPARLSYGGKGEEMPIVSNATAEGRAMNRRVELIESPISN